jgi:hypothetical protein
MSVRGAHLRRENRRTFFEAHVRRQSDCNDYMKLGEKNVAELKNPSQ